MNKKMNKYQEALDTIKDYMLLQKEYGDEDNISRLNKYMVEDLQELINIYKARPAVILQSTKNGNFVGDTTIEFNYEKALDKACEELAKLESLYLETGSLEEFSWSEEQWKKYLLRGN